MIELAGKTAIVTGAGRGIGRSIALELAKHGVKIVITSRSKSELESVAENIIKTSGQCLPIVADLSNEQDVISIVDQTINKFGTVDILVNNAGVGYFSKVADMKTENFDEMFAVNMRGLFLTTKAVLPQMFAQHSGDIINISSLAGRNAFIRGAGYCATKWAVIGFSRSLMLEVRENNIRVITICPGSVLTSFSQTAKDPTKIPKPDDIADLVIHSLMMPRNVMVSEIDVRPTNP